MRAVGGRHVHRGAVVQPPPSSEYFVVETPEPPSLAESVTVTAGVLPTGRCVVRGDRRGVVDEDAGDGRRDGLVAGDVGDDDVQVVGAVGGAGGVPGRGHGAYGPALRETSYCTVATPEPPASPVVELSVVLPRSGVPGLPMVAAGAVLSTRRLVTGVPYVTLPATSVATVRKS